jgi:hypothetical protein
MVDQAVNEATNRKWQKVQTIMLLSCVIRKMVDQRLLDETVDCIIERGEVIHIIKELLVQEGPCVPHVEVFEDPRIPKTPP